MKFAFFIFKTRKKLSFTLLLLWTIIIFIGCFIPSSGVPKVQIPFVDKYIHFIFFGGFGFLCMCMFRQATRLNGLYIFILTLLFGVGIELIQGSGLVYGRSFELNDIFADALGGLAGVVVFLLLDRKYQVEGSRF